jgi:hypothetical protein
MGRRLRRRGPARDRSGVRLDGAQHRATEAEAAREGQGAQLRREPARDWLVSRFKLVADNDAVFIDTASSGEAAQRRGPGAGPDGGNCRWQEVSYSWRDWIGPLRWPYSV